MADKKVSALTAITKLSQDDLFMVVNDPAGTPTSRKITTGNLFGNVAVITKHSSNTTFTANTTFSGTTMAITANVTLDGTNIESKFAANTYLQSYIANTNAWNLRTDTNVTGTNTALRTLISDRMQVANTTALVNDRIQVANAVAITGSTMSGTLIANGVSVVSNTGLTVTVADAPSSNNPTTEGWSAGTMAFSNNFLYIAVDANTIKRVALSVFS